jgi:predicted DNA-binding protein (MmcQ/YjbR family)
MNIQQLYEFCLSKKGVTEHFPFDEDTLVFKVGGKMFALTSLEKFESGNPSINLKCDPEKSEELRAEYEGIVPGYHMSKKHWNSVYFNQDVPNKIVCELIDHSYNLVFNSLTKKIQAEVLQD